MTSSSQGEKGPRNKKDLFCLEMQLGTTEYENIHLINVRLYSFFKNY